MKQLANRRAWMFGLSVGAIGVGSIIAACSGSSTQNGGTGNGGDGGGNPPASGDDGGNSTVSTTPGSCASPTVALDFSPMYSAFIPGSTAHTFQIPAVIDDGSTGNWSSSDPSIVALAADSDTGGIMITVQGTGPVTIFASKSDGTCGASTLNITSNTEDDWTIGNARYNDGVAITLGGGRPDGGGGGRPDGGGGDDGGGGGFKTSDGGSFLELDGGTACTNCHGATANSVFKDVSHTPEQTGGFSDTDLVGIITLGMIPDGGYFDPSVLTTQSDGGNTCTDAGTTLSPSMPECGLQAYKEWHGIHQWIDITVDEQPGIIVYLRSLQPEPQNGTSNFGGGGGGFGDGGRRHRDGGGGAPPADSGGETEQ
jgi:hypothetical protein